MKRKTNSKHYICESLLLLMETMEYQSITISNIVYKAGVNRTTFYRHFYTKEDVLIYFIENIMNHYLTKTNNIKIHHEYLYILFSEFYNYKKELIIIHKHNLALLIATAFRNVFEVRLGWVDYKMNYHLGGIYNTTIQWIQNGMKETPEEMTKIALSILPKNFKPYLLK